MSKIKVGIKIKLKSGESMETFIYIKDDEVDKFLERVEADEEAFLNKIVEKYNKGLQNEK